MRRTALREAVRALAIAHDPLGGALFLVRSRLPWLRASTVGRVHPGASWTVPAITLDSYFERHVRSRVDLLKVDVEGAEDAVLRGGKAALAAVENVVLELHPGLCDGAGVVARLRRTHPL